MPHLSLRNISKSFGEQDVLTGIGLELPAGAFLALLGPSGCGKTTLLRLIAGLERPSQGSLWLDGRELAGPSTFVLPEARGLGMVFQSYALWPSMTVQGNVEFGLKVQGMSRSERKARVAEVLATVGLDALADRRPHELSGGQRQRVALARSLALRPRMILLDEPLANLDAHLRQSMLAEFRRLHAATGATFVFVTHDQDEAMAVASHIAVMSQGRIEQVGTPETLYRRPKTAMVARFISHGMTLPVEVTARDGDLCRTLLNGQVLGLPGSAAEGPAWLCLHREDLTIAPAGQGHIRAEVLGQNFRNGRYLTHVTPQGIGADVLSLALDHPVAQGTALHIRIASGWVIARDGGTPVASQGAYLTERVDA
ncbi:ABC transporter ATP-binding protein [Paracoccus laeviglucosivorans]|uniref:Iron(III) transport system ATP-binding protein n=1 Tax=Paracoccus laeviglucosivorans TaxID=1197861 RepID=A0A521BCS0_9RHOB|nr:ABC transporter ATP-binding protein [Paracoccus laeviglucosivorans]SMO44771.1 iron(III) transport system ATP-binding protein [Paracoccus laeviglucosivorans]